jgi:hypothetical protein
MVWHVSQQLMNDARREARQDRATFHLPVTFVDLSWQILYSKDRGVHLSPFQNILPVPPSIGRSSCGTTAFVSSPALTGLQSLLQQ